VKVKPRVKENCRMSHNAQVPGDGVAASGFLFPSKAIASIQKPVLTFSRQMVQPVQ
jgi:hypothetical protein